MYEKISKNPQYLRLKKNDNNIQINKPQKKIIQATEDNFKTNTKKTNKILREMKKLLYTCNENRML